MLLVCSLVRPLDPHVFRVLSQGRAAREKVMFMFLLLFFCGFIFLQVVLTCRVEHWFTGLFESGRDGKYRVKMPLAGWMGKCFTFADFTRYSR